MCCGRSSALRRGLPGVAYPGPVYAAGSGGLAGVTFEYTGRTGLTAVGRSTGRQYRFDRPGARIQVDPRDAASVGGIALLRRVEPPRHQL